MWMVCPRVQKLPRSEPVTADTVRQLLATVEEQLGPARLLLPDTLRGSHASMHAAMRARGKAFWPPLEGVRGKVIVVIAGARPAAAPQMLRLAQPPAVIERRARHAEADAALREVYGAQLHGCPAFTRFYLGASEEATSTHVPADRAFVELGFAGPSRHTRRLLDFGFIVAGRADYDAAQAATGDTAAYDALVAAGVQHLVTDFVVAQPDAGHSAAYAVGLPCGRAAACDLRSTPSTAVDEEEPTAAPAGRRLLRGAGHARQR